MKTRSPSKTRGGRLSREDVRLWVEVAKTVTPKPDAALPEQSEDQAEEPALVPASPSAKISAPVIRAATPEKPKPLPLAPLERRLRQRLSRGQIEVPMKLDLHGLRQAEAHSVLRDFLLRAFQNDVRITLVVTGKGKTASHDETGFSDHPGVLRRMVPHWLSEPELRHIVLGFEEAAPSHGGSGALFVRLRSNRRSGAKSS
jgi:DNA-nicking Smr family endonuclease